MNLEFKIFQKLTQESTPSIGGQSIPSAIHLGSESISINEDIHFSFPQLFIVGILF